MQVSEIRFAVPTDAAEADLPRVASIIGAFDVTGLIIDGARVGAPGWVFARTLGDTADSTLLHFDTARDAATFLLPWATVREALVETFGTGVLVGTELDLGGGRKVLEDGLFAVGGEHAALAVLADRKDHMFGALATGVERDLIAARVADWIVVSGDGPAPDERLLTHLDDRMYDVALAGGGRAPALVLWRRGEFTHVALVRNGDIRQQLLWGPRWGSIEPASLHRFDLQEFVHQVGEDLGFGDTDGAELVKHFRLDKTSAVHLRATIRREVADVPHLLALLGLPPIVAEVFAGGASLSDLPQARAYPATSKKAVLLAELTGSGPAPLPPDPTIDAPKRGWRRRP